ncbi:MAG: SpoIIIAH-like family protein, partial [Bacilli bacterium]|nr:SpoIIIAH-like family protein [Bacilli bacterium]
NDDDNTDTTGRLEELTEMRIAVREERAQVVLGLDAVISDSTATIDQKTAAVDEKRYINFLNEKELLLELQVIKKGYQDCFVHATSQGVEVIVITDEHSVGKANEILLMAMASFNFQFDNVYVNFQTVEQVSGKAG